MLFHLKQYNKKQFLLTFYRSTLDVIYYNVLFALGNLGFTKDVTFRASFLLLCPPQKRSTGHVCTKNFAARS